MSLGNHGGQLAGALIGLAWLGFGWWAIAVGNRHHRAGANWVRRRGQIVDKDGSTEGLFLRNPHVRYDDAGIEQIARARSRGDLWEPGQAVDILVDPDRPGRIMLARTAQRGTPYVVIGWFLIVVAVLTLVSSLFLALWVPSSG